MKKIKRIIAKANVTISFFTHPHIVIISDDKNVMKITNGRKNICSTKNCSYQLNRL